MVTATKEMTVYDIFQGQQVRKVDRGDGKVWRVLIDCSKAVGMGNVTWIMKRIPKQHFSLTKVLGSDGRMRQHWLIDDVGLIDMIAYGRLPKEQLDAFRELIGQRAAAPAIDNALAHAINRLTDFMEKTEARLSKLESKPVIEPLLLKPVIDYSERVRLLIRDWIESHSDNPRVTYPAVHQRLNTRFLYRHKHNISEMGKNRNKSALQVAIDLGMGAEMLSLAQELVNDNFEGYFSESEIPF